MGKCINIAQMHNYMRKKNRTENRNFQPYITPGQDAPGSPDLSLPKALGPQGSPVCLSGEVPEWRGGLEGGAGLHRPSWCTRMIPEGGWGGFEDPLASPETAGAANGQILPPSAPPPPLWVTGSRCSDPPVIQKGKLRLREVRRASLGDKGRQERLLCDL